MALGGDARQRRFWKELRGVRLLENRLVADSQSLQSAPPQKSERLALKVDQVEESVVFGVQQQQETHVLKALWNQRPACLRTVYSGNEGDRNLLETIANVATSMPFVLIGLHTPRRNLSTSLYANSVIGVGMASTMYHVSRGEARKYTRWGDYAMIAASTLCLSTAIKRECNFSRMLILSSAMAIPFQPLLVTALHTSLMEATFARKVLEQPRLRKAYTWHTASTLIGGALFVADDIYPNTPYIHAAWHIAAAVGVATLNSLLE
ncbi:unnamed protein product [Sphagnum jensenii]|uniref:Uncharacterized protein n=1 Tax=Sphagnum jensenii TaxID=128206 RepID=A0ABP0WEE9_9BRYO